MEDLEGTLPKVSDLSNRVQTLERQNADLIDDLAVIKGILQVHDKSIENNKDKVVDLTARSMANNVIIMGLVQKNEDQNEHE